MDPAAFAGVAGALLAGALAAAWRRPSWIVGHPRSVLVALFALTLAATAAIVDPTGPKLRLSIDPSTEPLLPTGDPANETYDRAVLEFGDDEVFVVAMETDDVFTSDHLRALRRVSDAVARLDGVRGVKSLVKVTYFRYSADEDWVEVRPFIEDVPDDPAALRVLRERALADPIYRQTLISRDGRTAALNVTFRKMTDREFIAADLDGKIRRILDDETRDGRQFTVSGRPHIKSVMYHSMIRDLTRLIPIALAIVAWVLVLTAGTVRGVVLPLATVGIAVVWTFGAVAFLGRPLNLLTILLAPTLVAIGSVYGVHVITRYEEEAGVAAGPAEAAHATLRHIFFPVVISGLTTVIGFAALLVTDVPAVFELGAFSVLGIACITVISLTGVPAALALLPLRSAGPAGTPGRRLALASRIDAGLDRALAALAHGVRRFAGPVILTWAALGVVSALLVPHIVIDTDYLSYFREDAPVRKEFDRINRLLSGAIPLFVVIDGGEPGWLRDPGVLRSIETVQGRIDGVPGVTRTLSFLDTMRVLNRAIEGGDPAEERIPETRGAIAELLFMMPKSDMQRFETVDQQKANLIVRTGEVGSAGVRRLTDDIAAILADGTLPTGARTAITGSAVLLSRAADGVARNQPLTVGLAVITIFTLLAAGLRSLRLGLVAMAPNVLPVLIYFGLLGAGFAPLSLPTSLIGSVALGIAIDATVHFIVRYRAERDRGCDPDEAARRAGVRVGRPIAVTSAMLILGFLSIAFSEFATLQQFAILSAATMAVCCLTDLILLPAMLVRFRL